MDLISRQDAIDAMATWEWQEMYLPIHFKQLLEELPSAQRKGKWIPLFGEKFVGGAYWFECSKCKRIVPEVRNGGWNYCPNCGASMERGEEE